MVMSQWSAALLSIAALIGMLPVIKVAWLFRDRKTVPVGKRAFWAMALGLLGIGLFYGEIFFHGSSTALAPFSRVLWALIIISTVGMADGVLLYRKQLNKANRNEDKEC